MEDPQGRRVLDRFVGHISIGRPNRVVYAHVLRFEAGVDSGLEYDGGLVVGMQDGRRVGLVLDRAPAGLMKFITDDAQVDEAVSRSRSQIKLQA